MNIQKNASFQAPTRLRSNPSVGVNQLPQSQGADFFQKSSFVDSLPTFAAGAGVGAVGIGGPAALAMGAGKALFSGHPLAGIGLAVAAVGVGSVTVPLSLMVAAMSTDSGDQSGLNGFKVGAGMALAAGALAIF